MEEGKGPHGLAVKRYARPGIIRDSSHPAFLALAPSPETISKE